MPNSTDRMKHSWVGMYPKHCKILQAVLPKTVPWLRKQEEETCFN